VPPHLQTDLIEFIRFLISFSAWRPRLHSDRRSSRCEQSRRRSGDRRGRRARTDREMESRPPGRGVAAQASGRVSGRPEVAKLWQGIYGSRWGWAHSNRGGCVVVQ